MQEIKVFFHTLDSVKQFVNIITKFDGDFELIRGKYIVNAKSVMELFCVDLSKPVILRINVEEEKEALKAIQKYRVSKC